MIIHIALFESKDGISENKINELLLRVKSLKNKCEGIKNIFSGKNYHLESKGFTHGVIVIAENQKALDDYRKHRDHMIIAKNIAAIEEDGLGFDFEDFTP